MNNHPKQILFIADFDTFGGTRRYFNQLKEFYENHGYSIFYAIEPRTIEKTGISLDFNKLFLLPNLLQIHPNGFFQRIIELIKFLWIQTKSYKIVKNEIRKKPFDLIVVSTGYGDRYLSILAINKPCLYINHSTPEKCNNEIFYKIFLSIFLDPRKRIVAVSEHMQKMIKSHWGTKKTSKYLISVYNSSKESTALKITSRICSSKKTILTLGHVIWYKNPEFWIKVIECFNTHSQFKDYSWIWAGDGDLLEKCRKTITDKNITNASFIGYSANVEELYDKALIYFQPSILESFGLSVLDAMQRGIPCVVTRVGGLPELVIDGETGFIIEDGDMKSAVEKISWLLSHPEESEKMGRAGYLRYKNLFTEEKWIENMERIHKEILSEIPNNSK